MLPISVQRRRRHDAHLPISSISTRSMLCFTTGVPSLYNVQVGTSMCNMKSMRCLPCAKVYVSKAPAKRQISRFTRGVPPAPPKDTASKPRRGRDAKRRMKDAESFRQYVYLRKQLKPWSDAFRAKHGRTPNLVDVHNADVPGLMDRFLEYLDALESMRDYPALREWTKIIPHDNL